MFRSCRKRIRRSRALLPQFVKHTVQVCCGFSCSNAVRSHYRIGSAQFVQVYACAFRCRDNLAHAAGKFGNRGFAQVLRHDKVVRNLVDFRCFQPVGVHNRGQNVQRVACLCKAGPCKVCCLRYKVYSVAGLLPGADCVVYVLRNFSGFHACAVGQLLDLLFKVGNRHFRGVCNGRNFGHPVFKVPGHFCKRCARRCGHAGNGHELFPDSLYLAAVFLDFRAGFLYGLGGSGAEVFLRFFQVFKVLLGFLQFVLIFQPRAPVNVAVGVLVRNLFLYAFQGFQFLARGGYAFGKNFLLFVQQFGVSGIQFQRLVDFLQVAGQGRGSLGNVL